MRTKSSFLLTITALSLQAWSAFAVTTLNTVPEGILTLNIAAPGPGSLTSYYSLPLIADPVYTGAVSGVTANTISVTVDANNPAPFVNGTLGVQLASLATPALPYFVKFLSGAETGRTIKITANTSSVLTLDTTDNTLQTVSLLTSGFAVAPGDAFEVFPAATLSSLFGDNTSGNPLELNSTASVFTSDTVSIYNPSTQKFQTYFFNTTVGYWVISGSSVNANNTILAPYSALVITRRGSSTTTIPAISISPMARVSSISSVGSAAANTLVPISRVPEVAAVTKTTGSGAAIYGSTSYPVDLKLSQLQLGANWIKGTSAFNSDTLSVYNQTILKFDTYYQLSADSIWRKVGATGDQSNVVIPAGAAVSFLQRGNVSGGTSFLSSVMPYVLN